MSALPLLCFPLTLLALTLLPSYSACRTLTPRFGLPESSSSLSSSPSHVRISPGSAPPSGVDPAAPGGAVNKTALAVMVLGERVSRGKMKLWLRGAVNVSHSVGCTQPSPPGCCLHSASYCETHSGLSSIQALDGVGTLYALHLIVNQRFKIGRSGHSQNCDFLSSLPWF